MTTNDRTSGDRTTMRWSDQQADGSGGSAGARPGGGSDEWQERLALRNWSLPVKLAAVLLVPTVFVVSLGVLRIVEQTEKARSYDGVQQAVSLEDRTSTLLADLAAERTAAAVYVASRREGGPAVVRQRGEVSETSADEMRDAANSADSLDEQARSAYNDAANGLQQLYRLRTEVQTGRVDAAGVVARYTERINALLAFDRSLTREAADPSVAGLAGGLYALSVVREEDAYVQAVVASAIAAGRIDAPSIDQARNATLRRTIAVDDFRAAVGTDDSQLSDAVVGPDVDARDRLAQVVLGRGSAGLPLQVAGPEWERASAAVTERVADTSEQLRGRLQASAQALQDGARNAAGIASVVLLLALIAGAAVVFFVTRSLLRPLRLLRRTALDVAERRLPGAVRSLREGETPDTDVAPTPIQTREEIGQVARAFDQVHEQAVRLAAEQAGLRSAFNSIFVNLSRRSQALVERQLRLIEQLENNEEDPESLSNLFQLDHLATRMRRNSENLLVLSGTDLSRRGTRPVPVVDVLRAAASEVEQYQRVDLQPPPNVMLLGRTASDVVHLVAELLENATTFSAPDTRVDVIVTQAADGGLAIDIADAGVGMRAVDMADANQRLASPPTVDVSASRRMGLFVVGRLASRHGISVVLRDRDPAGIVAAVVVPAHAILAAKPGGGPRAVEPAGGGRGAVGATATATAIGAAAGAGAGTLPRQDRSSTRPALPTRGGTPVGAGGADEGGRGDAATSFFDPGQGRSAAGAGPVDGSGSKDTTGGADGDLPRRGPRGVLGDLPTRNGRRFPPPEGGAGTNGAGPNGAATNGAGTNGAGRNGTGGADTAVSGDADGPGARDRGPAPGGDLPRRARGALGPVEEVPPPAGDEVDDSDEADQADDRVASANPAAAEDEGVTVWRASDAGDDGAESTPGEGEASGANDGPPGRHGWRSTPPAGSPAVPPASRPQHRLAPPPSGQPTGPRPPAGPGAFSPDRPSPPPGVSPGRQPVGGPPPPPQGPGQAPPGRGPGAPPPERPAEAGGPGTSTTAGSSGDAEGAPGGGPSTAAGLTAASGTEPDAGSGTPADDETRTSRRARALPMTVRRGAVPLHPRGADPPEAEEPEGPRTARTTPATQAEDGAGSPASSAEPARTDAGAGPSGPSGPSSPDGGQSEGTVPGDGTAEGGTGAERAPRPLGRRRGPTGTPIPASRSTPRMRPRRSGLAGEPAAGSAPSSGPGAGDDEGLFAPAGSEQGAGAGGSALPRRGAGAPNGASGPNGAAHPGPEGAPRAKPPRPTSERLPLRTGTAGRERTPIFDEVASVWFRESTPGDQQAQEWTTSGDAGWRAASASTEAADGGTTEAGLPRRRPRARLVPGAAEASPGAPETAGADPRTVLPTGRPPQPTGANGAAPVGPAGPPRRNADSVRGRLASYQRGVNEGRSSRRGPTENGDSGAPGPGDEEEQ